MPVRVVTAAAPASMRFNDVPPAFASWECIWMGNIGEITAVNYYFSSDNNIVNCKIYNRSNIKVGS